MKDFICALPVAFGMYSKLPVPRVDWNDKNMRYAMCFFPFVGAVIGALQLLVFMACRHFELGNIFTAIVMSVVPILVTGGIHMDGFLDTVDALASFGDREKRLQILKDPNSGAFAVTYGIVYMLLMVAVFSELTLQSLRLVPVVYVLSRALSGLAVVTFPMAKDTGLAKTFADGAEKQPVRIILLLIIFASMGAEIYLCPANAGIVVFAALATYIYHYFNCKRNFGGITGDLAGYFLQLSELVMILGIVIVK